MGKKLGEGRGKAEGKAFFPRAAFLPSPLSLASFFPFPVYGYDYI
jgi:hypothetical protein